MAEEEECFKMERGGKSEYRRESKTSPKSGSIAM
jgi:hypothetical protein